MLRRRIVFALQARPKSIAVNFPGLRDAGKRRTRPSTPSRSEVPEARINCRASAYSNSNTFFALAIRSGARQGVARRGWRSAVGGLNVLLDRSFVPLEARKGYIGKWNGFTAYDFRAGYFRSIPQERRGREEIVHQMNTQDDWLEPSSISTSVYGRFRST